MDKISTTSEDIAAQQLRGILELGDDADLPALALIATVRIARLNSALTTLRESITLAAALLGITGEPGEVVPLLVAEVERLNNTVEYLKHEGVG